MQLTALALASLIPLASCWSPTNGYAPGVVTCPTDHNFTREASGLSNSEQEWLQTRQKVTDVALKQFLTSNITLTDFNVDDFFNSLNRSITIGLAFSGGGYRAMLCGAGQLSALDNRTDAAFQSGLGGLLQATTYLAGLSGGNWLTGTISYNNFTSVQNIVAGESIWDLSTAIYNPGGINIFKSASVFDDIDDDIQAKEDAGFNASLTDIWARALSQQFFNDSDHGAALTVDTLRDADVFSSGQMPLPISVADGRYPGTKIISSNSTVFEITPFEIGSWDNYLRTFADVKYIGTNFSNGKPSNNSCYNGFDNAGFIMGTSSSLFNQFLLQLNSTGLTGKLLSLANKILTTLSNDDNDIADYTPNPFRGNIWGSSQDLADSKHLYLVDGGEDLQNVPLSPLITPYRNVDVIFAFDNSADTEFSWPNGSSLGYTYNRQFTNNGSAFPYVPDSNSFRALNLTSRPAFFGCDSKNLTSLPGNEIPPLVVFTANRPFSYFSNTSTFKMTYTDSEKKSMIRNGFEVASRRNLTLDAEWKVCVACAIIRRSQERMNQAQSEQCQQCFSRYCWDGSTTSEQAGVNFTLNGTTNAQEASGNTTSGAVSVSRSSPWAALATVAVLTYLWL